MSKVGPKLMRKLELAKPWLALSSATTTSSSTCSSSSIPAPPPPSNWSPRDVLQSISPETTLLVKQQRHRAFMYEERTSNKISDKNDLDDATSTKLLQISPMELANLLHSPTTARTRSSSNNKNKDSFSHDTHYYYYWTSPVKDVAPHLLDDYLRGYEQLHNTVTTTTTTTTTTLTDTSSSPSSSTVSKRLLDPRGPSLWMGSTGSVTQAHYDVADNIIVQLWGTKRIRIYSPTVAPQMHVFPDAHAKARKSQVYWEQEGDNDKGNPVNLKRFPLFQQLSPPILDCILEPGDALYIPAFWFHHVENGYNSNIINDDNDDDDDDDDDDDGPCRENPTPSVSLNMFAFSESMMVAQDVFAAGCRPFGKTITAAGNDDTNNDTVVVVRLLRLLAWDLCKELTLDPVTIIRTHLLDARYVPLRHHDHHYHPTGRSNNVVQNEYDDSTMPQQPQSTPTPTPTPTPTMPPTTQCREFTASEKRNVQQCLKKVLPPMQWLAEHADEGVLELVICHLMELWVVELLGADNVEKIWEDVLCIREE